MRRRLCAVFTLSLALLTGGCVATRSGGFDSAAQARADTADAIEQFHARLPATRPFFENSYGYAVFPQITRGAAGIGGVFGRGVLFEGNDPVSEVRMWQLIHGITFGGERHREIIFFRDVATLNEFRQGTLEWRGRAAVSLGAWGGAASPAYADGVAVFALSQLGVMVDASVAAANYSFQPIQHRALQVAQDGEGTERAK